MANFKKIEIPITNNSRLQCLGGVTENNFFFVLSCYVHMKKKLKYKLQRCILNIPKFRELISFTKLITNF